MTTTLTDEEIRLLGRAIREVPSAVVWDINAIYFVFGSTAIKVEATSEAPVPTSPDEEALCLRVSTIEPAPTFRKEGESGLWYRVMCEREPVIGIDILRACLLIPGERVVPAADPAAIVVDTGILVSTRHGVIPAVQLENAFGFHNWAKDQNWESAESVARDLPGEYTRIPLAG